MELKDFVRESLLQIIAGVSEAQDELEDTNAETNPRDVIFPKSNLLPYIHDKATGGSKAVDFVEFDVAVTAQEGTQTKGGIGVVMGIVGIGSQGKSEQKNEQHSRLKFKILVALPYKE